MKNILIILLTCILNVYLLSGCINIQNTPEKAIDEIISCYNNSNISCFWEYVLPSDRYTVSQNLINNINNNDLFFIMSYALNKDNITSDNITVEEYLYGSFKVILGDKDMELLNIEKSGNTAIANIKMGEKTAIMPLEFVNDKWYMKLKD